MNLFIDTISTNAKVIIFDSNREIIDSLSWIIKGNESSTLIPMIDKILKENNIKYNDLENIVVVNGPGSFTGVRTTVLAVNSINYIIGKKMTAMSYFDLYNSYPIVKSSSKRDCFIKLESCSKIEIISNEEIVNLLKKANITKIYSDLNPKLFPDIKILEKIDYISIIKNIKFDNLRQIQALYIKKPNIS